MTRNRVIAIVVVLLVAVGGWYLASPAYALSQLRDAAVEGDRDELTERIDFPAVKESLKSQVNALMLAEIEKQKDDGNEFAGLGAMLGMAMVGPAVDAMVTPDNMARMVEQGKLDREGEPAPTSDEQVEWAVERDGFDRFVARPEGADPEQMPSLIFERDGLGWQLSEIKLPEEKLEMPQS